MNEEILEGLENYCKKCKWYKRGTTCRAYPEGIPERILKGELIHNTPWVQADRPYIFEEKKESYTLSLDKTTEFDITTESNKVKPKRGRKPKSFYDD